MSANVLPLPTSANVPRLPISADVLSPPIRLPLVRQFAPLRPAKIQPTRLSYIEPYLQVKWVLVLLVLLLIHSLATERKRWMEAQLMEDEERDMHAIEINDNDEVKGQEEVHEIEAAHSVRTFSPPSLHQIILLSYSP